METCSGSMARLNSACNAKHRLQSTLHIGVEPRYTHTDPRLLAKPCTLVHLWSSFNYTVQSTDFREQNVCKKRYAGAGTELYMNMLTAPQSQHNKAMLPSSVMKLSGSTAACRMTHCQVNTAVHADLLLWQRWVFMGCYRLAGKGSFTIHIGDSTALQRSTACSLATG